MFEVAYHFIQDRGALKGLELSGTYKVPERSLALRDARRITERDDTTGVTVNSEESGQVIVSWNQREGWV